MLNVVGLGSEGVNEYSLNFKETELCLGLPGGGSEGDDEEFWKRGFSETIDLKLTLPSDEMDLTEKMKNSTIEKSLFILLLMILQSRRLASMEQAVGWPPVRSYRKNVMAVQKSKTDDEEKVNTNANTNFVKVSLDRAPYLRKVNLKMYKSYQELSDALGKMFSSFTIGSEYLPTYEDKDGDWMLDVCAFMQAVENNEKGSEAIGLGCTKSGGEIQKPSLKY
ncbi:hypothetical protein GIB67_039324 [Kingdonia uniflora]|uniref:Auxin-responsive protein n=1 Tax=Kingdonia uniflora TaxID=39325 RepID=A0A7J7MN12_9MAGN|nr:hypothetical protein GIB67_039324 [Kingdonia uniflora]